MNPGVSLRPGLGCEDPRRTGKIYRDNLGEKDERRKQKIPAHAIKRIILGPNIEVAKEEEIKTIIKTRLADTPVFKTIVDSGSYVQKSLG